MTYYLSVLCLYLAKHIMVIVKVCCTLYHWSFC